ncbi:MAG: DUF87 domain-containing protein, partial [Phycisphaerales bacterium]|nr:DUF87 domain-containing protein [Phycisphaerales bacterium]
MTNKQSDFHFNHQVQAVLKKMHEGKLLGNESFQKLYRSAVMSKSPQLLHALEKRIDPILAYEQMLDFPFNPTTNQDYEYDQKTRLYLGRILQEKKDFRPRIDPLNQHAVILGSSGAGKSVLLMHMVYQFVQNGINCLIFDKDKAELRGLLNLIPDLNIFNIEKNFIFNPLQVPTSVDPQHWLVAFVSVFAKYNDLLSGSESLLVRAVNELYKEYGAFKGNCDTFPTIPDLYNKIIS